MSSKSGRARMETKMRPLIFAMSLGLLFAIAESGATQVLRPGYVDDFAGKPRVVVLSDIGNEPDDQMSFVRLLLYSNELDLEALIATTSTWQKNKVQPETMRKLIAAYGEVRSNLLKHAAGWPEVAHLDALVTSGQTAFGMAAVGPEKMSPGDETIILAADLIDPCRLWIDG